VKLAVVFCDKRCRFKVLYSRILRFDRSGAIGVEWNPQGYFYSEFYSLGIAGGFLRPEPIANYGPSTDVLCPDLVSGLGIIFDSLLFATKSFARVTLSSTRIRAIRRNGRIHNY
jgi:hypothetical protein